MAPQDRKCEIGSVRHAIEVVVVVAENAPKIGEVGRVLQRIIRAEVDALVDEMPSAGRRCGDVITPGRVRVEPSPHGPRVELIDPGARQFRHRFKCSPLIHQNENMLSVQPSLDEALGFQQRNATRTAGEVHDGRRFRSLRDRRHDCDDIAPCPAPRFCAVLRHDQEAAARVLQGRKRVRTGRRLKPRVWPRVAPLLRKCNRTQAAKTNAAAARTSDRIATPSHYQLAVMIAQRKVARDFHPANRNRRSWSGAAAGASFPVCGR